MKKIIIILFIIFVQNIYAQNFEYSIKLEYTHIYNKLNKNIYSYIGKNKILIIEKNDLKEKIETDLENNSIKIQNMDTSEDYSFIDLDSNLFFINATFDNKNDWFMDTLKIINWKIENKFKKIEKFNCQKATCFFAGRNYNAWFTADIPLSYGPWKLNGLPGLILEVYDDESFFYAVADKITLKPVEINNNKYLSNKYLTIKNYINLRDSTMDANIAAKMQQIKSQYGRESPQFNLKMLKQVEIEKEFEEE